jgi:hypothetical protein
MIQEEELAHILSYQMLSADKFVKVNKLEQSLKKMVAYTTIGIMLLTLAIIHDHGSSIGK